VNQPNLVEPPKTGAVFTMDMGFLRELSLPERLPDGKEAVFVFPDRVRRAFRAPSRQRVSDWAEKHFEVVEGSRQGPWRNANAPYLAGVLDTWPRYYVRVIVLVTPPQVGKSKTGEIVAAWTVDQNPGPFQYILPDELAAKGVLRQRFAPLFNRSARLKGYLTGRKDDVSYEGLHLKNMTIYFDWAGSAARLASKAIRDQVYDEWDKHPTEPSKKEASSADLAAKRQRTFRDRKQLKISTPTTETGPIWQAFQACAAKFHFHARCKCGHYQRLHFTAPDGSPRVCWPEGARDPDMIEEHRQAWYQCELCGEKWDDYARDKAVSLGKWIEERTGLDLDAHMDAYRPRQVGFHLSSLHSPFVSLSETAAAFLRSKGDKMKLRDFMNGYLAEPWVDYHVERSEDRILALRDERPRGLVPGDGKVATLVAGVDTQTDRLVYRIRAVGWGDEEATWGVREGEVMSFEALEQVLWRDSYKDAQGNEYVVQLTGIDAMGSRTKEVYDWARRHTGKVYALQGVPRMNKPVEFSNIDYYPGSKIPIPGGLKLMKVLVGFFKNDLAAKLAISPDDPGAFRLHKDTTEDYARQMTAEYYDDKDQMWKCPEKKANHFWDCEVYCLAVAYVLGVKYWPKPEEVSKPKPAQDASGPANWIAKRRG